MNVFCDFHHGGLYYSMHLLWEKRLGMNLYTMRGKEWYDQGYWKIYDNPGTVAQYLEFPDEAMHTMKAFPQGKNVFEIKMLRLEEFKAMKFDYIVASIGAHEAPFVKLRNSYQPQAKLIRQMGNIGDHSHGVIPNIMNSTSNIVPQQLNQVRWREEFDLKDFHYSPPGNENVVTSFLHDMHSWPFYKEWLAIQAKLTPQGFKFYEKGIVNRDGCCAEEDLSDMMRASKFVYHVKGPGDGFGHNVHHALACGRPLIINYKTYKTMIAGELLEPDVTCIDFDSVENVSRKILEYSEPKRHKEMCEAVFKRFKKVVDFDKEEQDVRKFLERCK